MSSSVCLYVSLRVCLSFKIVRMGHTLPKITNLKMTGVHFDICHSNGVIEKIALGDLDLLFGGKEFNFLYISQMVRTSAKNVWETFVDFDICHRMV